MESRFGRICTNGHIISVVKEENLVTERGAALARGLSESFNTGMNMDYKNPGIEGDSHCQKCGSKTIDQCPSCESTYIRLEPPKDEFEGFQPPDYCRGCGEAYPWIATIKEKKAREEPFVEMDLESIGGQFYPNLIRQINSCYQIKANEATRVLYRKLLESLLVDILRGHYGMGKVELFYDKDEGRTHPFSTLLSNFKSGEDDIGTYSEAVGDDLYQSIEKFKHHGDASAHTIEPDISNESIEEQSEKATKVAKILFEMRENVHVAN